MPDKVEILTLQGLDSDVFSEEFFWKGTIDQYLQEASENPLVAQSAYQRMYHAILSHGSETFRRNHDDIIRYHVFDDPMENGRDAIYDLEPAQMQLVAKFQAGAARLGQERRFLLLHGPVGSSNGTIARLLRKALCAFTRTDEGKLYTCSWRVEPDDAEGHEFLGLFDATSQHELRCPINDDPFILLPEGARTTLVAHLNDRLTKQYGGKSKMLPREKRIDFEGGPCPVCRYVFNRFLEREKGNWRAILEKHLVVRRLLFSELDRTGVGSLRPKDEKNQDATELSGDINYRKIAQLGSESDPRAFNFDGEFQVSNRGFFYVEEVLKLDRAFLYDFLGATQEHVVKPKRFAEMHIDEVLMGGTNSPEYDKIRGDDTMEAFNDRTTRIDIPYVLRVTKERMIYDRTYPIVKGQQHQLAPHTTEMAALRSVLTRLKTPDKVGLSLMQKAQLYDGRTIPGFTEDTVRELMRLAQGEGMETAISPRYIQDKLADALVQDPTVACVTPFALFKQLQEGLTTHSLIKGTARREEFETFLSIVQDEYDDIIKGEVQEVIGADKDALKTLFTNYIDNVVAYVNNERIRNPVTHVEEPPNERLMREIEEQIGVNDREKDDYRAKLMQSMGTYAQRSKKYQFDSDEQLLKALKLKLFNDRKDWVNLQKLRTGVVDNEEQEKINTLKKRLIDGFGYCEFCATVVLERAASLFSGSAKRDEN